MARRRKRRHEACDVPMTPLIDCVFLLLIFFLATSMFKRWEMIIPFRLPDQDSSLSAQAEDRTVLLGMDREGRMYRGEAVVDQGAPRTRFRPLDDLALFLRDLAISQGTETPIVIAVANGTATQLLIDAMDVAQIQGFQRVSVQTRRRFD